MGYIDDFVFNILDQDRDLYRDISHQEFIDDFEITRSQQYGQVNDNLRLD